MALAPVSKKEAEHMIRNLKSFRILDGYRGGPKSDINALSDAIVQISRMSAERANELKELDINPVFVYEKGICAVDALYIKQ